MESSDESDEPEILFVVLYRYLKYCRFGTASPPALRQGNEIDAALTTWIERWFKDDAALCILARKTLIHLTSAFPHLPAVNGNGFWYEDMVTGLVGLEPRLLGKWPLSTALSEGHWRYLVFTRCLYDALERTLGAWQLIENRNDKSFQAVCPLALSKIKSVSPYGAWHRRSQQQSGRRSKEQLSEFSGLGSVLAGYCLPPEGLILIAEAAASGVDWCRSGPFWALLPDIDDSTLTMTSAAPAQSVPSGAISASPRETSADRRDPNLSSRPSVNPVSPVRESGKAASLAESLTTALGDVILTLCREGQINRRDGLGWVSDGYIHVVAKALAERMINHPALAAQRQVFQVRKRLYRALLAHKLIEVRDLKPTATLVVTEAGQQHRATVVTVLLDSVWPKDERHPVAFTGNLALSPPSRAAEKPIDVLTR